MDKLHLKNGNVIYILNILKKYSDEDHILTAKEITDLIKDEYDVENDDRTIRRNISLLKDKLGYDISTRDENKKGYYLIRDYYNDFTVGELRTIMDTISFAPYITKKKSLNIIGKCMELLNDYELEKLDDYKIYSDKIKTNNEEVIDNIESIYDAIYMGKKIKYNYNKYSIDSNKLIIKTNKDNIISPYAIINSLQEFYVVGLKNNEDIIKTFRIDRMTNLTILNDNKSNMFKEKDIKEFIDSKISMFAGNPVNITIKFHKSLLDNIVDLFGKELDFKIYDKDNYKVTINVNEEGFKYWILRNIENVEIISPISLKNKINNILKNNIK